MRNNNISIECIELDVSCNSMSGFETMAKTILQDRSLSEEIIILKGRKVISGKLYKNFVYGSVKSSDVDKISGLKEAGYRLRRILPCVRLEHRMTEYYDDEYGVFVGPSVRSQYRMTLELLFEKGGPEPEKEDTEKKSPKEKHTVPF